MTRPTVTLFKSYEYNQGLRYYPSMVKSNRCNASCNAFGDPFCRICVANKTEDINLNVFHMIIGIDEAKTLAKDISYKCKCKFDGQKCNSNQKRNNNKC